MKDTIRDQIKALADKNGWLLIIIGLAAVGFSDIKMTMTLLQWAVFSLVIAGLVIVISRITFPQIKLSELMERVKSGDQPAALVVLGLLLFCGLLFVGTAMWAK